MTRPDFIRSRLSEAEVSALRDELRAQIETLTAERDEARSWTDGWHRACETICTIVGLPPALGAVEAVTTVRSQFEAAESRALAADTARASAETALAEAHAEAELQRQDAADNMRLIDAISDLIGQPHDVELSIEHVHLAWGRMREALNEAREALAEARSALKPFADAVQTGDDGEWSIVVAWPATEDWTRARAALEQKP